MRTFLFCIALVLLVVSTADAQGNNQARTAAEWVMSPQFNGSQFQVQTDQRTRGTNTGQTGLTLLDGMVLRSGQPFGRAVLQAGQAFMQTSSAMIPLDMPLAGGTGR